MSRGKVNRQYSFAIKDGEQRVPGPAALQRRLCVFLCRHVRIICWLFIVCVGEESECNGAYPKDKNNTN